MRPPSVLLAGLVAVVGALGLSGCDQTAVDASEPPARVGRQAPETVGPDWLRLRLTFEDATAGRRLVVAPVGLSTGLVLDEVTSGTAHVQPTTGPDGGAAAFGSGHGSGTAALVVHAAADELTPGAARLRLSADFVLDSRLLAEEAGANIVQRGLFDTGGQVKLQVDQGVPSCRIAGNSGSVVVEGAAVEPGTWYRGVCERDRARVTLYVAELTDGGATRWRSWVRTGATGAVTWPSPTEPFSVGAKVGPQGEIVQDSPDAFLGAVDNVQLEVEP